MTTIDWTQPVETCEDPPRPVRVLATDGPGDYPVICLIDDLLWRFSKDGSAAATAPWMRLRNVAPPKPEPVLREAWVAWDCDGMETVWSNEKDAADRARHLKGVYARAAVMSDGSPVPGEFRDDLEWTELRAKAEALQAEVARMRPVYDAAVAYCTTGQDRGGEKLLEAVRAEKEKTDG